MLCLNVSFCFVILFFVYCIKQKGSDLSLGKIIRYNNITPPDFTNFQSVNDKGDLNGMQYIINGGHR